MVQMSSTCPNGFPSDPGVSMLPQFHSRYCGHTLSRLAEIRHNKTKQTSFPTIRRAGMKSSATFKVALGLVILYKAFLHWLSVSVLSNLVNLNSAKFLTSQNCFAGDGPQSVRTGAWNWMTRWKIIDRVHFFLVHTVFRAGWRGFVLCQFHSRYCGHTLSRLAEIRHNKTKQVGFPTIRRGRGPRKSWNAIGFLL